MDTNGDGYIDENEIPPERVRMFHFMADRAGIDTSKPVPISRIVEAMSAMGGGGPPRQEGGGGATPSAPAAGQTPPSGRESSRTQPDPQVPPLVPSFGVSSQPNAVPGFGTRIEPPARVVLGAPEPAAADRRASGTGDRRSAGGSERRGSGETDRRPATERSDASGRGGRSDSSTGNSRGANSEAQQRASYRFPLPHERFPKGLPDWFIERDVNMDGQVSMREFADEWTDEKVGQFLRYDRNNDGFITVEEALNPIEYAGEPTSRDRGQTSTRERSGSDERGDNTDDVPAAEDADAEPAPSEEKPAEAGAARPWWME